MSDATTPRLAPYETIKYKFFPLAAGVKAVEGCAAVMDPATSTIKPQEAGTAGFLPLGQFTQTVDNSAGGSSVPCEVMLYDEIKIYYYANAAGGAAITALFSEAYMLDNQTVTNTSNSGANAVAGRVMDINPTKGIGVKPVGI